MAFRLTNLIKGVRVGITGEGDLYVEVDDAGQYDETLEFTIPAEALRDLQEYLARNA